MPENPTYVPLSKCSECPVLNIESCHTGTYAFPPNWYFESDAQCTFYITNQVGVKYKLDVVISGTALGWDMDAFPEGWKDYTQSLYVEVFSSADSITPITFTIGESPETYSCFWINFYKVQE